MLTFYKHNSYVMQNVYRKCSLDVFTCSQKNVKKTYNRKRLKNISGVTSLIWDLRVAYVRLENVFRTFYACCMLTYLKHKSNFTENVFKKCLGDVFMCSQKNVSKNTSVGCTLLVTSTLLHNVLETLYVYYMITFYKRNSNVMQNVFRKCSRDVFTCSQKNVYKTFFNERF